jgi:hypothetical protein
VRTMAVRLASTATGPMHGFGTSRGTAGPERRALIEIC